MTERFYAVDEIAAHRGIERETVERWIERGDARPLHREVLEAQGLGRGRTGAASEGRARAADNEGEG